jgi:hypothetical protein
MKQQLWSWILVAVAWATILVAAAPGYATIIGNWESGTAEGWIDWGNGQAPLAAPRHGFNSIGATVGTGAVQFNLPGPATYTQWAAIKLQSNGIADYRPDFLGSSLLKVDITLVAADMAAAPPNNDYASIGLIVNADGYGFTGQGNPLSVTPFTGHNGDNTFNPSSLPAGSSQTSTWTWDIADTHDGVGSEIAANPSYIELIFETYSNGVVKYHIDNVRLVPEPASLALLACVPAVLLAVRRRRAA